MRIGSLFCSLFCLSLLPQQLMAETKLIPSLPRGAAGPAGSPSAELLRDIRGPVPLGHEPGLIASVGIGAAILFVLLAFFLYRWWKARRNRTMPQLPCWIMALNELEELKELQTEENAPLYAERISHILRGYIEKQLGIKIQGRTSGEFLAQLRHPSVSGPLRNQQPLLAAFLKQTDLVKFACAVAHRTHLEEMERIVRNFIETTRPRTEAKP